MRIALIDYGSGNLRSAAKAFERVAAGGTVVVTADPTEVARATHVVLPGVGAFRDCRDGVVSIPGMMEALERAVIRDKKPFLGICVGMQLMASWGREHGDTPGFGWIAGEVARLNPKGIEFEFPHLGKIPHMGWNSLHIENAHPALINIREGAYAYFVHSYALHVDDNTNLLATADCTDFQFPITAIVGRENLLGTQFHPEKSQHVGLAFLAGFLKWRP